MSNSFFQFKHFTIHQDKCAMKVTTDSCLFGAWIAEQIRIENEKIRNVLDIGTGTGLLSMMLAQKVNAEIEAIEIDKQTAHQAEQNVISSPFAGRIHIHCTDILQFQIARKFDIIISNPPFYETDLKSEEKRKNIAQHNDGLLLTELLKIIQYQLQPTGIFFLLLPFKRKEEIKTLLLQNEFSIQKMTLVRQSTNHDYFRIMIMGKKSQVNTFETIIDDIAIKDKNENYTSAFTYLLKDYYLYL